MQTYKRNKKKTLYSGNSQGLQQGIDMGVNVGLVGLAMTGVGAPVAAGIGALYHAGKMGSKFITDVGTDEYGRTNVAANAAAKILDPLSGVTDMARGFAEGDIVQALDPFGIKAQLDLNKEITENMNKEPEEIIHTDSNNSLGGRQRGVVSENVKEVIETDLSVEKSTDNTSYAAEGAQVVNSVMSMDKAMNADKTALTKEMANTGIEMMDPIADVQLDVNNPDVLGGMEMKPMPIESAIQPTFSNETGKVLPGQLPINEEIKPFELPENNYAEEFKWGDASGLGLLLGGKEFSPTLDVSYTDKEFSMEAYDLFKKEDVDKKKKKELYSNINDLGNKNKSGMMFDFMRNY